MNFKTSAGGYLANFTKREQCDRFLISCAMLVKQFEMLFDLILDQANLTFCFAFMHSV